MHSVRGAQIACQRAPMARETDTRRTAALESARGAAPQVPSAPPLVIKGTCGAGAALPLVAAHRLFAREEPLGAGRGRRSAQALPPGTCAKPVMNAFTYMRSEADRV